MVFVMAYNCGGYQTIEPLLLCWVFMNIGCATGTFGEPDL
jgi:hypothetical protein